MSVLYVGRKNTAICYRAPQFTSKLAINRDRWRCSKESAKDSLTQVIFPLYDMPGSIFFKNYHRRFIWMKFKGCTSLKLEIYGIQKSNFNWISKYLGTYI